MLLNLLYDQFAPVTKLIVNGDESDPDWNPSIRPSTIKRGNNA